MPSWNIHTAHVERLLADHPAEELGIADANAFLFGNYVPDVYVGFMVPDASMRVDYCITHLALMNVIPVPDADLFWDNYIARRAPSSDAGLSLVLGAWAHLVADRFYNGWYRTYSLAHVMPEGEELRVGKQNDFNLFGSTLGISSLVEVTPKLLEAAWKFHPYRILPDDVKLAVDAANDIVRSCSKPPEGDGTYRVLSAEWMSSVFDICNERLAVWLATWQQLKREGERCLAVDVRAKAGLPPATPDDPNWSSKVYSRKGK